MINAAVGAGMQLALMMPQHHARLPLVVCIT